MNITPFDVYLVMQLDQLGSVATILFTTLTLICVFLVIFGVLDVSMARGKEDRDYKSGKAKLSLSWKIGTVAAVFLLFGAFIPSTKTAASMFLLPAIANNKEVQQLPEDLLKMVRGLVKEWTPKEDVKKEGK